MSQAIASNVCPECRQAQSVPIENGQCISCHDRFYLAALAGDDEVSASIVEEYRMTAAAILGRPREGQP